MSIINPDNSAKDWSSTDTVIYDLFGRVPGSPASNAIVQTFVIPRPIAISIIRYFAATPPTADANFNLLQNNVNIGTLTISASAGSQPVSAAFTEGDVFMVQAPSLSDATLADIAFTYSGIFLT